MTVYEIAHKIAEDAIDNANQISLEDIRDFLEDGEAMARFGITDDDQEAVDDLYDMCKKLRSFDHCTNPARECSEWYASITGDERKAFELLYAIDSQADSGFDPSWQAFKKHIEFLQLL